MQSVRRQPVLRFFAFALVVWLAVDALCQGTCSHDLIRFARAAPSEVGDTSTPHPSAADSGDANHCSCHWQYLPSAPPFAVELAALTPVVSRPAATPAPQICRSLERPPQRCV